MIKVVNDTGGCIGTRVYTETNEELVEVRGVESLQIDFPGCHEIVRAKVVLGVVKAEVTCGSVEWLMMHPLFGEYKPVHSIGFADGTSVSFGKDGTVSMYPAHDEGRNYVSLIPLEDGRVRKFKKPPDPK